MVRDPPYLYGYVIRPDIHGNRDAAPVPLQDAGCHLLWIRMYIQEEVWVEREGKVRVRERAEGSKSGA